MYSNWDISEFQPRVYGNDKPQKIVLIHFFMILQSTL